jgi:lysophospholipase L1-like esterase
MAAGLRAILGEVMNVLMTHAWWRRVGGRTVWTSALVALLVIVSGTAALAGPSLRPGLEASHPGTLGTVSAEGSHARQLKTPHLVKAGPQHATGALSTVSSVTVHGGYTAAGIGMRNLGYGTISLTGVPTGAVVKSATLMWDILANQADPTFAQGSFNGKAITGTGWASGASPCWPVSGNFSYEADVTSLVTGNGSYRLSGFATGESDGADPWTVGSTPPLLEGASLVVVYRLASMPQTTIQIAEGATETDSGNSAVATMNGFTVSAPASVATTYIVADGQEPGNTASFNGTTLPDVSFPGADPQAVPNYSRGNLWDTVTTDVSPLATAGETSASLSVTGYDDCLVWVGQVLSVSGGAVLGLGDSVAAGYGLGPSQGNPDNSSAYPVILGHDLGLSAQDYAIQGACAVSLAGCPSSVANEIGQIPDSFAPSLITLTVGADDINFGGCLKSILADSDLSMTAPSDPCSSKNLEASLAALSDNLTADLSTLSAKYPGVPIEVMDYYNAFPPAPAANESPCGLDKLVGLLYEHAQQNSWLKVAKLYVLHPRKFNEDARYVQAQIYSDGQSVLAQLNATINAAAAGYAKVINTSDFSGHDICAGNARWVFEPTVAASISLHVGPVHGSAHFSTGGEVCPDPVAPEDWNIKVSKTFDIKKLKISGSLNLSMGVNCLPHPNTAGQAAIASDFAQQAGQP